MSARRLLHLHRGARARRSERVAVGGRAQRPGRGAHLRCSAADEQKERYLTPLARGEKLAAWGLTEPGSGSDAAAMRTTATRDGDDWVLNGSKTFITHGASGDTMVVMAVTDKSKGNKGISAFIVERGTPGFIAGKKEDKLGMRASETTEVIFQNCRIPASQLIGEEGQGFIQTLQVLDAGRIGIAALVRRPRAGRLRGGAQLRVRAQAVRPADRHVPVDPLEAGRQRRARRGGTAADLSRRVAEGSGPADDAGVVDGEALRERDRGARVGRCVQIHGGYGFVKDYPAEKFFRDVKLTTIGEGTSEVQRLVIARQLLAPDVADPPRTGRPRARRRSARDRARHLADRGRSAASPPTLDPRASFRTPAAPISSASPGRRARARARWSIG